MPFCAPNPPMAAAAPVCNAGPDAPGGECDNRKRAVLERWNDGVMETWQNPLIPLPHFLPSSLHGKEFLLDSQLRIFGKESLGNENFIWCEIAGRNRFVVFDVLLRIN